MAGTGSSPSGNARMKFFLFSMTVMLGLGFFGGVTATKRAMKGPDWLQHALGIEMPPPEQVVVTTPKVTAPPVTPTTSPSVPPTPPTAPGTTPSSDPAKTAPTNTGTAAHSTSPSAADPQGFLGHWEITDEVQAGDGTPTKIQSGYKFNVDGTGEFDTNGKKMYDLRWNLSGEFLTLTYDSEQAPQGEDGAVRMRWSVTPDKTLLTLVPENGKDARATLYSVGPGVYHKK